jgi:hypothetical protein
MAARKKTNQTPKKHSPVPPALADAPARKRTSKQKVNEAAVSAVEPMPAQPAAVTPAPALMTPALVTPAVTTPAVTTPADVTTAEATSVEATAATAPAMPSVDVAGLIVVLRGSSAEAACEAAEALGNAAGDRSAVAALSAVVTDADGFFHPIVRAAAAASLGRLGDVAALPALAAATRDSMAEASAEAVRALATLGDRSAVPALIEIVRNRDGFFLAVVRRAAVLALVHLGGPEAIAMLQAVAAKSEEDPVVRQAAVGQAA